MTVQPPFRLRSLDLFRSLVGLITPLGVQGSRGESFQGAIFGRDSLRVGLDLVPWLPPLAETVIFSLAAMQATEARAISDAKGPGQIPHEARFRFVGPRQAGPGQQEILERLAARWGGTEDAVIQYGSADATPQFVRLVAAYCRWHGDGLLDQEFRRLDGRVTTLRQSVRAAIGWTEDQVRAADPLVLGFRRSNEAHGHRWQILQDGATSVIHADGRLANADARIETLGLQGLAYDCLVEGADLLAGETAADARRWRALAGEVQRATLAEFWLPEEAFFAMAIDRDPVDGRRRLVRTRSAMPTELLETRIFDALPATDRARYVGGIVRTAHGPDFMTEAGIRSRALRHADLLPYPDYHGVAACWGVTNSVYAHGLARQGFPRLARDVACRHLNALQRAGGLDEFLYVDPDGVVRHVAGEREAATPAADVIYGTNLPETDQGWTVSFALRTLLADEAPVAAPSLPVTWQDETVRQIARRQPLASRLLTEAETVEARRAISRVGYVDRVEARRREAGVVANGGAAGR